MPDLSAIPEEWRLFILVFMAIGAVVGGIVMRFGWFKGKTSAEEAEARPMLITVDKDALDALGKSIVSALQDATVSQARNTATVERELREIRDELRRGVDKIH